MPYAKTYETIEQQSVTSRPTLPAIPYPNKHFHCAFDSLEDAVKAVKALRAAGFDAGDIFLMTSRHFVEAVDAEPQQQHGLREAILRIISTPDNGFRDVYLREARSGRPILAVRLFKHEHIAQVRDVLVSYGAHHMKYIDTWTYADLS